MEDLDTDMLDELHSYMLTEGRNHVVFCRKRMEELTYIDVGQEVARALRNGEDREVVIPAVLAPTLEDNLGDRYLAVDNIGILFEPELKFNIRQFLEHYSRGQCLIIRTDADIQGDILYYLSAMDGIRIPLADLSYKII